MTMGLVQARSGAGPRDPCGPARVVLVDDEEPARGLLREYLGQIPGYEVVAECASGDEAPGILDAVAPDVLFLDVELPGLSGVDVLERIRRSPPAVILSTAHSSYAVRAFDVGVVDYLLKPYDRERFTLSLDRARRVLGAAEDRSSSLRLWVRDGGVIQAVAPQEIDWVEAMDNYVGLHVGERTLLAAVTMAEMERRLPGGFLRVHRSAMVNLERVTDARPRGDGRYLIRLSTGVSLTCSRSRAALLKAVVLGGPGSPTGSPPPRSPRAAPEP